MDIDLDPRALDKGARNPLQITPIKRAPDLHGTLIVARDIAHARIKQMLGEASRCEYFRKHPIYYAGRQDAEGMPLSSFGPTTAGRMNPWICSRSTAARWYAGQGQPLATGDGRLRKHGGFYLGSIGPVRRLCGPGSIKSVEVVDFPELGMEAVRKIYVENFPAFILVVDKGNDFSRGSNH